MNKKMSFLGLGCATFGREITEMEAVVILDEAVEMGMTLIDTAAAYSNGRSETIVGNWLSTQHQLADSLIICTKVLPPYTQRHLVASVDQSIGRLKRPIDVFYLHSWHEQAVTESTLITLDELRKAGKIGSLGVSNFNASQLGQLLRLQQLLGLEPVRLVQNNHNLAVSDLTTELRKLCLENQLHIVTYSPLGAGYLTGKHLQGIASGSRFDYAPGHWNIYGHKKAEYWVNVLREVAEKFRIPITQVALAWAYYRYPVNTVLIGSRSVAHLEQALKALDVDTHDIFKEIEEKAGI